MTCRAHAEHLRPRSLPITFFVADVACATSPSTLSLIDAGGPRRPRELKQGRSTDKQSTTSCRESQEPAVYKRSNCSGLYTTRQICWSRKPPLRRGSRTLLADRGRAWRARLTAPTAPAGDDRRAPRLISTDQLRTEGAVAQPFRVALPLLIALAGPVAAQTTTAAPDTAATSAPAPTEVSAGPAATSSGAAGPGPSSSFSSASPSAAASSAAPAWVLCPPPGASVTEPFLDGTDLSCAPQ
jgi:hypothetical protein